MEYLEIKKDLSVLGIKLGATFEKCIKVFGNNYKEITRPVYKKSYVARYKTLDYFNGGLVLFFEDNNKLISIAIDKSLSSHYKVHYDNVPIFDVPRNILINIFIKKYGYEYLDTSDLNFITSKDGLLIYSETVFNYSELEDPYFKLMASEDQLSYFDSIFISSFSIGNLNAND